MRVCIVEAAVRVKGGRESTRTLKREKHTAVSTAAPLLRRRITVRSTNTKVGEKILLCR